MQLSITLQIILQSPPPGVDFALQKGSGRHYETAQKRRSDGGDLRFEFAAGVKIGQDALPDFHGHFVQGPPKERFIYLNIGASAGQIGSIWERRLKVPLRGISREMIKALSEDADLVLETTVPGTGKDGGPNCATVKPFEGWRVVPLKQGI